MWIPGFEDLNKDDVVAEYQNSGLAESKLDGFVNHLSFVDYKADSFVGYKTDSFVSTRPTATGGYKIDSFAEHRINSFEDCLIYSG